MNYFTQGVTGTGQKAIAGSLMHTLTCLSFPEVRGTADQAVCHLRRDDGFELRLGNPGLSPALALGFISGENEPALHCTPACLSPWGTSLLTKLRPTGIYLLCEKYS